MTLLQQGVPRNVGVAGVAGSEAVLQGAFARLRYVSCRC